MTAPHVIDDVCSIDGIVLVNAPFIPSFTFYSHLHGSEYMLTHSFQRKAAEKAEKASAARSKGKKDPKAPKRSLSAYMFFSQDWRERIKAENPDAGFGGLLYDRACSGS